MRFWMRKGTSGFTGTLFHPPRRCGSTVVAGRYSPFKSDSTAPIRVHPRAVPSLGSRVLGCWINTERLLVKSGKAMVRQAARRRCVQVRDNDAEAAREL